MLGYGTAQFEINQEHSFIRTNVLAKHIW